MEYELKDLGGEEEPLDHSERPPCCGGAGDGEARDARPLHKPDPSASGDSSELKLPSEIIQELEKKYAAFVRRDVYGTMGRGELPLEEKVLIAFALATLVPIRLVIGVAMLVFYYVVCRVCTLFKDPNLEDEQEDYAHMVGWRREVVVRLGMFLSRAMLCIMGFYWIHETCLENTSREHSDKHDKPGAIVSNHVSYLDILYHVSSSFPSFVAKRSVAKLPLVGLISKCLGCIYVQRESKASECKGVSGAVVERVSEAQQSNLSPIMMLFPEGTTTNGEFLLPFKTGAFLGKAPVLPVILRYPYQRFSPAWDSISGVRHVILLLCQFVNHMEVIRLPVYHPSQQEMEDPKLYANNVRKLMATEGDLTLSDVGLTEKRVYHAALNGNGLALYIRKMTEFFLTSSKIFLTSHVACFLDFLFECSPFSSR